MPFTGKGWMPTTTATAVEEFIAEWCPDCAGREGTCDHKCFRTAVNNLLMARPQQAKEGGDGG